MKGTGVDHHTEILGPITEGQKDDVAAVQKTLFRVKAFAENKNSGPVPVTAQLEAMQAAAKALMSAHGALSAGTVAEFDALGRLATARDATMVQLAGDAVPALEKLLAEAEELVIDFFDIREHVMDIKTLEVDIEGIKKGDRKDKAEKIVEMEGKVATLRAELKALIEKVGLYELNPVDPQLETARLHPLSLPLDPS
jgi:hypothetical protein